MNAILNEQDNKPGKGYKIYTGTWLKKEEIEERTGLCKCMHEILSRGDIYGVKGQKLIGVTFEFVLYMGGINI